MGFELPAGPGRLTVRENPAAFASLYRGPLEDPDTLLERVDPADAADRRVDDLSKGMRMRLNLARALVNRPELLFLDEPTSGQDPVRSALLRELVRDVADAGCTVFLTTHDMVTADPLCDRLAFVARGRIAAIATPRFRAPPRQTRPRRRDQGEGNRGAVCGVPRRRHRTVGTAPSGAVEILHTTGVSLDEVFATVTRQKL